MLTLLQRVALVERVNDLAERGDLLGIFKLLSGSPEEVLLEETALAIRYAAVQVHLGDQEAAAGFIDRLLARCVERGDERGACATLTVKTGLCIYQGDLALADEVCRDVIARASEMGDQRLMGAALMNAGVAHTIRCNWDTALSMFARAITAFAHVGKRHSLAAAHQNVAMTYRQMGYFEASHTHFEYAFSFRPHLSDHAAAAMEMERALLVQRTGDTRLAETMARRSLAAVDQAGNRRQLAEGLRVLGTVLLGVEPVEARALLMRALELAVAVRGRLLQAEIHEELGVLEASEGNRDRASLAAGEACRLYCALGADAQAERVLQRLHAASGGASG